LSAVAPGIPSSGKGCQSRGEWSPSARSRREPRVEHAQGGGRRQIQPRRIDLDEQRLAAQADEGHRQRVMAGVTEDDEAGAVQQLVAPLDENLAPAMFAQRPPQIRRRARDDDTAFVELRQRVAQGAASGAAGRRAPVLGSHGGAG
jgi:hypothetical protein